MSPSKPTILVQLVTDSQPSVFDAVVAVDARVQHIVRHGGVTPENVRDLVYGTIFTRGPADRVNHTVIFHRWIERAGRRSVFCPDVIKKTFSHRKANSVDLGTADKVAVAALALWLDARALQRL